METRFTPEFRRRTMAKISWRLLPLVVLAYLVAYIDRTNVSVASLTMNKQLGIDPFYYGLGAGIFFIGYALFEIPSNIILEKVGARLWIARIMITWGIVSGLMAAAVGPWSFVALRFALGVAEAGFFPGMILYFTYWYPAAYRGRVISTLFIAVPLGNALASIISGAILEMDGIWDLHGWQWVFIVEAIPAVLLAFVVLKFMTDRPAAAKWLTGDEKEWVEGELAAERRSVEAGGKLGIWQVLTDRRVLAISAIYFFSATANYGITFFLPQIVKGIGTQSNFMTSVLSAIPYLVGVVGLLAFGYSSDKHNERRRHLITAATVGGIGFAIAASLHDSYWALVGMSIATVGTYGCRPTMWPMPSFYLTGAAAAVGIALINSIGNLGGYVGPFVVGWIKDSTKSFEMAVYFLSACSFASATIALLARRATGAQPVARNEGRGRNQSLTLVPRPSPLTPVRRRIPFEEDLTMCPLCSMNRRLFLRKFGIGAAAVAGTAALGGAASLLAPRDASAAEPVILGSGNHRYRVEEGWGELPPGYRYGDAAAVVVDKKDNVYVFSRGGHPVIVFDRNGKFLRSWGEDVGFTNPHGAAIGPDEMLYLTDDHGHAVRKFTLDGKLVMTIGTPSAPAERFSGNPFNRCTHTALSPTGDIYVSDGYQNARVHKYSPDGKLLFSWGEPGTAPGQFNLVHNVCCDDDGWVYVADRENHRVQVFDGNGKYETQWNNLMRPCGLFVARGKKPLAVVGELGPETAATLTKDVPNLGPRVSIVDNSGKVLAYLGTQPVGEGVGQFIAPHGVTVDSHGDIYVAEVSQIYWSVLFGKKPDHELRALQKLVKIE